ncbi:hypothetical protein QJS10_CPB19g00188 [Acorus calamus]|uniref:PB1 domain-containing protein n=1 Tax=Acorus calamus TaxID=4465 RepID=A0AAV9CEU2_ACOCL|nr:hypothetical protein QJS10_CPB19g00188 [Acorus calamus]
MASSEVGVEEGGAAAVESEAAQLKFLCSHGGKILPRPSDGLLKYVGGETRVLAVPRTISYEELMKKVKSQINGGEAVLKYQLSPEDLEVLVSVTSEEDLRHMLDEHDRFSSSQPRLRLFLFPSNPPPPSPHHHHPSEIEQRYIDALNGVVSAPTVSFTVSSSADSSPKSTTDEAPNNYNLTTTAATANRNYALHRVHSSPNLYGYGGHSHNHHHQTCHNNINISSNNYRLNNENYQNYYSRGAQGK